MSIDLKQVLLPFKGERDYIQSADFFTFCEANADKICGEKAFVKTLLFRNLILGVFSIEPVEAVDRKDIAGEVVFATPGEIMHRFALVDSGNVHQTRAPFDEEKIKSSCSFEGARVTCAHLDGYDFLEIAVALIKFYHMENLPSDKGKWIFARIEVSRPPVKSYEQVSVEFLSSIGGRYSKNRVYQDDEVIGEVQFALV